MININNINFATSTPRSITVGFPLLPSGTSVTNPAPPQVIGEVAESDTLRFFNGTRVRFGVVTVLPQADFTLSATRVFGFNLEYQLSGTIQPNGQGFIRVANDASEGGAGVGLNLRADLGISTVQRNRGALPQWMFDALNQSDDFNIDLFALVVRALARLAGLTIPPEILAGAKGSRANGESIFGLFANSANTYASTGAVRLNPEYNAQIDISKLIPKINTLLKKLEKAAIKITFGPQINFEFPIEIRIVRFTDLTNNMTPLNNRTYTVGSRNADNTQRISGPNINAAGDISQAQTVHQHTIGFRVSVGVFISFKFIGITVLSHSLRVPLNFGATGAPRTGDLLGPFFTTLSTNAPPVAQGDLPEVVWG